MTDEEISELSSFNDSFRWIDETDASVRSADEDTVEAEFELPVGPSAPSQTNRQLGPTRSPSQVNKETNIEVEWAEPLNEPREHRPHATRELE